jgi:hypothetical protein
MSSRAKSKSPAPKKGPYKSKSKSKSPAPNKKESSYDRLFQEIDADGSGGISVDELQHSMVSHFNVVLTTTQVERMVAEADLDHNGVIDLEEFKELMKKLNTSDHSEGVDTWVQMTGVSAAYNTAEIINDLSAPLHRILSAVLLLSALSTWLMMARVCSSGMPAFSFVASLYFCHSPLWLGSIMLQTQCSPIYLMDFADSDPEMVKWVILVTTWLPSIVLHVHLLYHSQFGLDDVTFGLHIMDSDYQPAGVLKMMIRFFISLALICTVFGGIADFFYFLTSTHVPLRLHSAKETATSPQPPPCLFCLLPIFISSKLSRYARRALRCSQEV